MYIRVQGTCWPELNAKTGAVVVRRMNAKRIVTEICAHTRDRVDDESREQTTETFRISRGKGEGNGVGESRRKDSSWVAAELEPMCVVGDPVLKQPAQFPRPHKISPYDYTRVEACERGGQLQFAQR